MIATETRPPPDVRPATFFGEWLPAIYRRHAAARRVEALDVRVVLLGDDGGSWDLRVGGPTLEVREAAGGAAGVTIRQTVQDWRALACGEAGGFDLLPERAGPLDFLFVDPAMRAVVAVARGLVRFEVPRYNGRTWWAEVELGTQPAGGAADATLSRGSADATISIDAAVYGEIVARRLQPAEAFFAGHVRLDGDAQLAMQVALAILPRFGG